MGPKSFALLLFRCHLAGQTVQELAAGLAIPEERVHQRLRAAARYYEHRRMRRNLLALAARVNAEQDQPT